MSHSNAFTFKNSGLNDFLFAEVGSELNGSPLTILSVLARLGKDPWVEASRLARLSKSSTIDELASSISQMPLCPQALLDARTTAARLALLLPSRVVSDPTRAASPAGKRVVAKWVPLAAFLAILGIGIGYQILQPASSTGDVKALIGQATGHSQAATK